MKIYSISTSNSFTCYGPFYVKAKPTEEELKTLNETLDESLGNIKIKVKEVKVPDCLSDMFVKLNWIIETSTQKGDDLSWYVSSTDDANANANPNHNTWTKDITKASRFNSFAVKREMLWFENLGRRNYYPRQISE